ncbi:hypothetical protein [Tunturiibacter psychrotolerans]|uniref:hypothetical protein n=1 Tax=Tunturiibacter psychrotolerans TaxID=3069686 RepID=UPI003D2428CE
MKHASSLSLGHPLQKQRVSLLFVLALEINVAEFLSDDVLRDDMLSTADGTITFPADYNTLNACTLVFAVTIK